MNVIKQAIWGPDPKEQMRKVNLLIRKNKRQLDRELALFPRLEKQTELQIRQYAKKGDTKLVRMLARELVQLRKHKLRLHQSRAQIDSVGMKVNEQYQLQKLQTLMKESAAIMHDVNVLVKIPELQATMRELEKELMKLGIISEMVDDTMESLDDDLEDEEGEEEINALIDKVVAGVMDDRLGHKTVPQTALPVAQQPAEPARQAVAEGDDDDAALEEMRKRLQALQD